MSLAPCPCGQVPTEIGVVENGQGGKWMLVYGDCCAEWRIEFRNNYHKPASPECMALAVAAWNGAPRGKA